MSYKINGGIKIIMSTVSTPMGQQEPPAHPRNCDHECPYGHGRAFCWPCMKTVIADHKSAKKLS
ncbi:hypothetical protein BXO88_03860 [Oribacterium sp. C9]|uniref:hypothetical protein n=1 Tax=Oribacterium sp. C9 TaxID=1943579 RepID=UPI00098E913D|nr:hypothetical protein [Oribacterium sp. C9]OON87419.1 hypothetical protein BXO88_03860 [Oribacterium sp. C9]